MQGSRSPTRDAFSRHLFSVSEHGSVSEIPQVNGKTRRWFSAGVEEPEPRRGVLLESQRNGSSRPRTFRGSERGGPRHGVAGGGPGEEGPETLHHHEIEGELDRARAR